MECSCLLGELVSEKKCFLYGGGLSAVKDCSFEFLLCHFPFRCDGDAVYSHVFEYCGGEVCAWGELVKLV